MGRGKMKHLYASIFCLFFLFCNKSSGVVIVPIGFNCTVAGVLGNLGFRKTAYPFDWMISSFDAIYQAFEDNFNRFLDPSTLQIGSDFGLKGTVIDFYGLKFVHDFPTSTQEAAVNDEESVGFAVIRDNWRESIPAIRQKYQRRIERLQDVLSGSEPVLFIRYQMLKNEAIKLRNLLLQRYPQLDFTIIAAEDAATASPEWKLEKIKNFPITFWGDDAFASWKKVFSTLGIEPHHTRYMIEDEENDCECDCASFNKEEEK